MIINFFLILVTEAAPLIGEMTKLEQLRRELRSDIPLHELEGLSDTTVLAKHVSTIVDQIKHLRTAIESTIQTKRVKTDVSYEGSYFIFDFMIYLYIY